MDLSNKASDTGLIIPDICPVTSLPITIKPEWTDINVDNDYSVSFSLIGNAILQTVPNGIPSDKGTQRIIEEREKVLKEINLPEKKHVEVRDHSKLKGKPTKKSRMILANYLVRETNEGNLLGFWVFNAPLFIRWMFDVGVKLYKPSVPVAAVKKYREAVKNAVNVLDQNGINFGTRQYKSLKKDDWCLELDNYGVSFELFEGNVIYSVAHGVLKEAYIDKFFKLHEKVLEEAGLTEKGYYYRILNWEKLEKATWKSRRMYINRINILNKEILPCNLSVLFGQNKYMSTLIRINKRFIPVPVTVARDLEHALEIIRNHKKKDTKKEITNNNKQIFKREQIENYSDELLQFVANINWDQEGHIPENINNSHPFKSVFDSIEIVKADIDDLLHERKKEEEKYRTVLENVEEGYYEVDLAGNLTFFNHSLCRILGYSEDELMGMNYREYSNEENTRKVFDVFNSVYKTGKPYTAVDWKLITKDGVEKHIEASVSLIKDIEGQPVGFRGVARDISERTLAKEKEKESKRELEKANNELEAINNELEEVIGHANKIAFDTEIAYVELNQIFNTSADGMWVMDRDFNVVRINKALLNILNKSSDDTIGKKCYEVFLNSMCHGPKCPITQLIEGNERVECDMEKELEGGMKKPFILTATALTSVDDEVSGIIVSLKEISGRKRAETLEREMIKAEASNKSKSEFLANMSHEIRTPLNGIIGMAELAMEDNIDDNLRNIFQVITTEANSLFNLINDILDFSKIEAGKVELEEIAFNLRYLIEDVSRSFALRAEQKGLAFISFLSSDVKPQLIGDPSRMRQILINLAGNAMKFTREGEIFIKGELAEDLGDKIKIRISVKDTGIGIAEEKQSAIFESFTQADGSTTREYGGTGLGTTISKQLTDLMGGEIGLESEEGKGSTFWFTTVLNKQKEEKAILPGKEFDLKNLKILVVDHNQTSRYVLMEYLRSWGSIPVEVGNGKEAMSILTDSDSSKEPFNLILTDFQMLEAGGFDLVEKIKTEETLKGIPIIVLISVGMKGDGRSCRKIGINGYLTKPIRQEDLHKTILSVLGLSKEKTPGASPKLVTKHSIAEDYRKDMQILLVEDYPTNQQVAMRHLQRAGYRVDLSENGEQAVEAYKQKSYDVILMDIQMPVMDGYEATNCIRELELKVQGSKEKEESDPSASSLQVSVQSGHTPIIAMTAHAIEGYRERCIEAGMDDYMTKPLKRKGLLAMVEKWSKTIEDCQLKAEDRKSGNDDSERATTTSCQSGAPMDIEKAVEEFEGDREFLMEVVDGFLDNVRGQISLIRQAISDGNAETVRKESHSIKGGAANLTAKELSEIAFELENIGKSGDLKEGINALERLKKEFQRLEVYTNDKRNL